MALEDDIRREIAGLSGSVGIYFEDLADGEALALNADEPFPGASVMKVPLLVEIMRLAAEGTLDLATKIDIPLHEARFRQEDSSGILTHLKSPVSLSIEDLCVLMIIESDNIATNLLFDLAPEANRTLAGLGLQQTRVTHPILDFPRLRRPDANPITAREIVRLYRMIYRGELPGAQAMLDILKEQHSEALIPALLRDEEEVVFAHKTGGLQGVMHDTGLVITGRFAYGLALLTQGGRSKVQATQALARLSRVFYDYMKIKYEV